MRVEVRTQAELDAALKKHGGDPYAFKDIIKSRKHLPGPEGYFQKPIDKDEFLRTINRILS